MIKKIMEQKRAQGKIPTKYVQSMRDHQKNVERLAQKAKPEKLRSKFDFDLWGEQGNKILTDWICNQVCNVLHFYR